MSPYLRLTYHIDLYVCSAWRVLCTMYTACSAATHHRTRQAGFWWGELKEGINLEDLECGSRIILEWIFNKWNGETWTGLLWFRIGTRGGLLVNAVMSLRAP